MDDLEPRRRPERERREARGDLSHDGAEQDDRAATRPRSITRGEAPREGEEPGRRREREDRMEDAKTQEWVCPGVEVRHQADGEALAREQGIAERGDRARRADEHQAEQREGDTPWDVEELLARAFGEPEPRARVEEREGVAEVRRGPIAAAHGLVVRHLAQQDEAGAEQPLRDHEHEHEHGRAPRHVPRREDAARIGYEQEREESVEARGEPVTELYPRLAGRRGGHERALAERPMIPASVAGERDPHPRAPQDDEHRVEQEGACDALEPLHAALGHGPEPCVIACSGQALRLAVRTTPFTLDALPSMTPAEVRARRALASSALFTHAVDARNHAQRAGARVTIGRLDALHGAIVERIVRPDDTLHVVTALDVEQTFVVAGDADVVAPLVGPDVHVRAIDAHEAVAMLRAARSVALLPIEIVRSARTTLARVFLVDEAPPPRRAHLPAALAHALHVDVALVRAVTWLDAGALAALTIGDAITLDYVVADDALLGRVAGDVGVDDLDLRVQDGAYRHTGRASRPRPPRDHLESIMEKDVPLDGWADVEVELTLDVGAVRMPLAELAALAPGAVLVPASPSGDRVTIRANGRPIGRGTLVRVDGALAVRVDELAGAPRSADQ